MIKKKQRFNIPPDVDTISEHWRQQMDGLHWHQLIPFHSQRFDTISQLLISLQKLDICPEVTKNK